MTCEPWPVTWPCEVDDVDAELLEGAAALAGQLLWTLSGYRIGVCGYTEAFRPATSGACGFPYKDSSGNWRNGGRIGDCCRVLLTHQPVQSITEVTDDGIILDVDQYTLEGSWLRRRGSCWSASFPCDDPDLIVVYQAGVPYPAGTGVVVGEVACEYLSALQGGVCRLPSSATSITRQGVTVTLADPTALVGRRRLGLPVTDAWLETVVGSGPRIRSRVYSPDLARGFDV